MTTHSISAAQQFRAIAYLRWRIFLNSFRRKGGKGELIARALIYPLAFLLLLAPVSAAFFTSLLAARHHQFASLVPIFSVIFLLQVIVSINISPPGLSFDPQSLIRFPLSFPRFLIVRIFLGLLSASTIVGTLCLLASATAVAIVQPRLAPITFAAALLLAITNMLFVRMVFAWVDRWLSTRRAREIFTVFIFAASLGFQYLNVTFNNVGHGSTRAQQARIAAAARFYDRARPVVLSLPPGLAASAVINVSQSAPALAAAELAGVALTGALCLGIFAWRMQREYRGENLSEAGPRKAAASTAAAHATPVPGVPGTAPATLATAWSALLSPVTLACLRKEFLYIRRNTSQFYGIVAPLAMIFILAGRLGSLSRTGFVLPVAALYSMLGVGVLSYNVLGLDGAGVQFYFFAPVTMRAVLLGKNLFGFCVNLMQVVLLFVVLAYATGLPGLWLTLTTLAWIVLVILVNVSIGNMRSITTPKKIDPGKVARKQASQLSALLSIGVILALGAVGGGLILLARVVALPWLPLPILLALAAAAFVLYLAGLNRIDAMALNNREILVEELTKVSV